MKLNKFKVLFVFTETLLLLLSIQQMITTRGWISNIFIFLPLLNLMIFLLRNEFKFMISDATVLIKSLLVNWHERRT